MIDFLDFHWSGSHFPAFNVADSGITVGAFLLILDTFVSDQDSKVRLDMTLSVDSGTIVTLHFALVLEDGHVIDSNFEAKAATFTVGDGNLLPGFESSLMGLVGGDEREFTIAPENAFGQHNPQNVQEVDRSNFDQKEIEVGAMFSFQNGDGELPGVIVEINDDRALIDFNHPLAGKNIIFQVHIIDVAPESLH